MTGVHFTDKKLIFVRVSKNENRRHQSSLLTKRNYWREIQLGITQATSGLAGLSLSPSTFGLQIMTDCQSFHQAE